MTRHLFLIDVSGPFSTYEDMTVIRVTLYIEISLVGTCAKCKIRCITLNIVFENF